MNTAPDVFLPNNHKIQKVFLFAYAIFVFDWFLIKLLNIIALDFNAKITENRWQLWKALNKIFSIYNILLAVWKNIFLCSIASILFQF